MSNMCKKICQKVIRKKSRIRSDQCIHTGSTVKLNREVTIDLVDRDI